jgi:hypothetical protein
MLRCSARRAAACFHRTPPGGHAPGQKGGGLAQALVGRIVVFHLVVVPDHAPVALGVGGLQQRIAFVQRIAVAVVLQGAGRAQRLGTGQAFGLGGLGVLVDVVAQKQHQVRLVLHHGTPGGVVAVLPALAGGKGQAQPLHRRTGCWRGAAAPVVLVASPCMKR